MKLTSALLVLSMIQVMAATGFSQYTELSLDFNNTEVKNILGEIEQKSEVFFLYNSKLIDVDRRTSIEARNESLEDVLVELFRGENVDYKFMENQIILFPGKSVPQPRSVSGTVTDEAGDPLVGVTIRIEGTTVGTITNLNGEYELEVPNDAKILIYSFVGMETQEIPIEDKRSIYVTLEPDVLGLEEVIVVGYGTVKKVDMTGSIGAISSEVFEEQVNQTLESALKGRFAGVNITSNDGAPGASSRIRIRGTNTITGSGEPLYVIDGVPVVVDNSENEWGGVQDSPLSFLNPNEIESVQVLKDASATAIYGSRGSNGVILVQTKTGENQKMSISLDAKYGISEISKKYEMMNTQEFVRYMNYYTPTDSLWWDQEAWADSATYDYQDLLSQTGQIQDYNLAIRGHDENTTYAFNIGWFDQAGVLKFSDMTRVSSRLNLTQKLTDNLSLSTNLNYSETNRDGLFMNMNERSLGNKIFLYRPYIAPFDSEGDFKLNDDLDPGQANWINPYLNASNTKKQNKQRIFTGKVGLEYKLGKYLILSSSYALNKRWSSDDVFFPVTTSPGLAKNGRANKSQTNSSYWVQDNILTFNNTFNDIHSLTAMIGTSLEKRMISSFSANAFNFPLPMLNTDYLGSASEGSIPLSRVSDESLISYFSRVNYNFNRKYYLTASIRADGSSHFGENNKWGIFPSGAFKWRINQESFLRNINTLSDLSLRLSYGVTGNQSIPSYQTLASSNAIRSYFHDQGYIGLITTRNSNPDLKWETTSQYNAGLDVGFLKNRITANLDAYYKITDDMLLMRPMPRYTGYTSKMDNIGSVENKGIELAIQSVNIDSKFTWETQFNIAFNRNKVLSLGDADELILHINQWHTNIRDELILQTGKPIAQWYGYIADGVYTSWEDIQNSGIVEVFGRTYNEDANGDPVFGGNNLSPGMQKFKDISGPDGVPDGIVNEYDKTVMGCGLPDFTGSFTNNFFYKGFSLGITLTYSYGAENFNANLNQITQRGGNNKLAEFSDFFIVNTADDGTITFDNLDAKYPSPYHGPLWINHSNLISDASFIRLANVVFGYSLPSQIVNKIGIEKARIYITGNNLYLWTKYTGYDPEVATGQAFETGGTSTNLAPGWDFGSYPAYRSVSVGLNVTF